MKITRTLLLTGTALVLLLIGDAPRHAGAPFGLQLVPEAHAIFGVWRRHARRWAVVGTAAVVGSAVVANANNNAYNAGYNDATATEHQQQAAATQQPAAPPPATGGKPLPLGTVTQSLPPGCTATPVGGKQYYYCSGNFYRAVLQGNNLVYVTTKP